MNEQPILGRVVATERAPNTPHEFRFWTALDAPVGIGTIVRVDSERAVNGSVPVIYGVVTEGFAYTDLQTPLHDVLGADGQPGGSAFAPTERTEIRLYTAAVLRQIWMPLDIRVEDGFLWMMIVTDGLRSPTDLRRVRRAEQASHQFEAYTGLEGLFKHERWQIVGNTINSLIYEEIQRAVGQDQPAGAYVAQRNRDNPRWVAELTQAAVESRRWRRLDDRPVRSKAQDRMVGYREPGARLRLGRR